MSAENVFLSNYYLQT